MKRIAFAITIFLLVNTFAQAQTVVSRKLISAVNARHESPQLVPVSPGKFAIVYQRPVSTDGASLFARLVAVNGATVGATRSNLLGTQSYRWTSNSVTALAGGGFAVGGTRLNDRQLALRFFDAAFKPKGATVLTGVTGYSPQIAPTANGFVAVTLDGFIQTFVSTLDGAGKKSTDPVRVVPSNPANGFVATRLLASPAGGFVVGGMERTSDGSRARASSFSIASNATSISRPVAHEPPFSANVLRSDFAFSTQTALMAFGRNVSSSRTDIFFRTLGSKGQNAGAIKKFNTGNTTSTRFSRLIWLTGKDEYLFAWEDSANGIILLQVLNANGTPVSEAFQLSPNTYVVDGPFDLAWDPESQTLLATWTENVNQSANTGVWVGAFKID